MNDFEALRKAKTMSFGFMYFVITKKNNDILASIFHLKTENALLPVGLGLGLADFGITELADGKYLDRE